MTLKCAIKQANLSKKLTKNYYNLIYYCTVAVLFKFK